MDTCQEVPEDDSTELSHMPLPLSETIFFGSCEVHEIFIPNQGCAPDPIAKESSQSISKWSPMTACPFTRNAVRRANSKFLQ